MTSSLPSPETGNQVGDVDTPCPRALFKEVGHDIGERMRVCGLGDTVPGEWGRQVVPLVICLRKVSKRRYHVSASEP